jgi:hypothetical protein
MESKNILSNIFQNRIEKQKPHGTEIRREHQTWLLQCKIIPNIQCSQIKGEIE